MMRTATATATERQRSSFAWWTIHAVTAAWIVFFLVWGRQRPLAYSAWLQEDGFVEWLTVTLFGAAAILRFRSAWPARRWFDLLVALFCVFVAGEEFSWGQRLLGFTPPEVFLEHNKQQELTLHNFAKIFGQPKGVLMLALVGYAALPLLIRFRLPATPPARSLVPWFISAALLLWVYPLDLTGEWVEALAAWLFLVSARPTARTLARSVVIAVTAAALLATVSARFTQSDPAVITCARREVEALASDIAVQGAARAELYDFRGRIHKRLYTAIQDGYIEDDLLRSYRAIGCGQSQRYLLDPWGMAYWIRVERDEGGPRGLSVYSMGANRRRDHDDVASEKLLP